MLRIFWKSLWLDAGWFKGEKYVLLDVRILEVFDGFVSFFSIKILKLTLSFGYDESLDCKFQVIFQ